MKSYQFFYLIFGCPTLNFRLFSREQRHAPILITAFIQVSTQSSRGEGGGGWACNEVGSLCPAMYLVGFEPGTFQFIWNT